MPHTPGRTDNFPVLFLLALAFSLPLAAPASAGAALPGRLGVSLSAGTGPQWPLRGDEGGANLLLGADLTSGPHLLEIRHVWFWHPGFYYMTSVDRVATLVYGHALGLPTLHGCIGFGLYEDYGTPGIQAGLRFDWTRVGFEGYVVKKDYPALGINFTVKTGDLLD